MLKSQRDMCDKYEVANSLQTSAVWPRWMTNKLCCLVGVIVTLLVVVTGCDNEKKQPDAITVKPESLGTEAQTPPALKVSFANVTTSLGVNSAYQNGEESDLYTIAESLGGGVAAIDYDSDGRIDLMFPSGGSIEFEKPLSGLPSKLFRNQEDKFIDVSNSSAVADVGFYTHGVSAADVDSDGFPDLLVTGYYGIQLLMNCGDGTYRDATGFANLMPVQWTTSSGWGDFDNDGYVDFYVASYVNWSWQNNPRCGGGGKESRDVCTPQSFPGLDDVLFWNNGDGTFTRDTGGAGLVKEGKGLGVIVFDVNYDSKPDIYVANDTTNNFLYLNQGSRKFKEIGVLSGTAFDNMGIPNGSMGLAIFDQDDDRKCDLFVTNYERETFAVYRNDGRGNFRHISDKTGITALGRLLVGFGTISGDFGLTGREDIVVANGHVMRYPGNENRKQEPLYIQNRPDGKLTRIMFAADSFFSEKVCGRGVIAPDLNFDGKLDLVFSNVNEPAVVLQNSSEDVGNWVGLKLIGTHSNRDAIGALVELETDKRTLVRQVIGGGSYLSQGPYQLHFGIPQGETMKRFRITWPQGNREALEIVEGGKVYLAVESKLESL